MRRFAAFTLLLLGPCLLAQSPPKRIIIAASTVFDGAGGVLHNARVVVEGSKIVAIDAKAKPVDYDLRNMTLLPGWIDAHVHISSGFGEDGKFAGGDETTVQQGFRAASNAWRTPDFAYWSPTRFAKPLLSAP